MSSNLADLLQDPQRVAEVPAEHVPALLCQLSVLQTALAARLAAGPPAQQGNGPAPSPAPDRLLTVAEAAALLRASPKYLYRHHKRLPFARPLGRRMLRFSEAGLQKWLAQKRA